MFNPSNSQYLVPIFGAVGNQRRGINSLDNALVNQTADGIDLNVIWDEWADVLDAGNSERMTIASLLSIYTTQRGEAVPQTLSQISSRLPVSSASRPLALLRPNRCASATHSLTSTCDWALRGGSCAMPTLARSTPT